MYAYLTHGSLPPTLRSNPKERDSWSVHRAKWAAAGKRALTLADARFQKDIQQRHSWQFASWDSDLEAFSRNPTDGSFAVLAFQLATFAK